MPTVSVIVPNYNHARFLRKRIDCVLAQTCQDFELILLDDCSTDGSREILEEYASRAQGLEVRLECSEVNSGSPFKQWNKGVRLARGEYVWIAESDDYADPRLLERLVGVLERDSEIVVAYCRSWCVREDGRIDGFVHFVPDEKNPRWETDFCVDGLKECREVFPWFNPIRNASSAVFRRAAYEEAGGADETFRVSGDWKLWAGMALKGKMAYICEPLNYQHFHGGNTQNTAEQAVVFMEILGLVRWLGERVTPSERTLNSALDWLAGGWVPLLMSARVPLERKKTLFRGVLKVDPHPFRRALMPMVRTAGLKVRRHWREMVG